jgi:hypothetical protein
MVQVVLGVGRAIAGKKSRGFACHVVQRAAARSLLRRLLDNKLSRYESDPLAALARIEAE